MHINGLAAFFYHDHPLLLWRDRFYICASKIGLFSAKLPTIAEISKMSGISFSPKWGVLQDRGHSSPFVN